MEHEAAQRNTGLGESEQLSDAEAVIADSILQFCHESVGEHFVGVEHRKQQTILTFVWQNIGIIIIGIYVENKYNLSLCGEQEKKII